MTGGDDVRAHTNGRRGTHRATGEPDPPCHRGAPVIRRALCLSLLVSAVIVSPALAAPTKDGGCPGPYQAATYAEMAVEFPELVEAFGMEGFLDGTAGFDNNNNGTVCWMNFPSTARVYETFLFHVLVIDDNAVGLGD